jgi:cell division protease FtsH
MREQEKHIVAYHESGHALIGNLLAHADPVHKVSIIPRGSSALGYTLQLPLEDRYLVSRSELLDKLAVLLAGRASEELVFGEVTTGAQNDLTVATHIARKMITEYGMSGRIGPVALHGETDEVFLGRDLLKERNYSEELAYEVDREINRIIESAYRRVTGILKQHKDKLVALATELEQKEVLESADLERIIGKKIAKKNGTGEREDVTQSGNDATSPSSGGIDAQQTPSED